MNSLRSAIKHNFLKQVIFRFDYEGILDADVERCVLQLRQIFYDAGFTNMETRIENQVDLQLKMDLNIPVPNQFLVSNSNQSPVYIFSSNDNEVIEINKSFFVLTVEIDSLYKKIDKYIEVLTEAVYVIKNLSPYFRAHRIGLRKINICFLNKLDDIVSYFTRAAFNLNDVVEQFCGFKCSASNMVTILSKDGFQVNYIRNIQEGLMQNEDGTQSITYQVVLDIDVFKEGNKEIMTAFFEKASIAETLKQQNLIEFEIFIKSLEEEFVAEMKQDVFNDDKIKGVI